MNKLSVIFFVCSTFVACMGQEQSIDSELVEKTDEKFEQELMMQRIHSQLETREQDDSEMVLLTPEPVKSALGGGSYIRIWVNKSSAEFYQKNDELDEVSLPLGTLIIREVFNESGDMTKVTAAAQLWDGYNQESFDMWFAVADTEGHILHEDDGAAKEGPMEDCNLCHKVLANGFFGLP